MTPRTCSLEMMVYKLWAASGVNQRMSAEATLYRIHCILQASAAPCYVQPSRTKTTRDDADDDPSDRAKKRQATPQDLQEELAMLRQERDQLKQDKSELEQQKASLEATVTAIKTEIESNTCGICLGVWCHSA